MAELYALLIRWRWPFLGGAACALGLILAPSLIAGVAPSWASGSIFNASQPSLGRYSVTIALPAAVTLAPLPTIYGPPEQPLVVIDAGHGGHDPGARATSANVREKEITLAIARAIRDELVRSGRLRVAMTREDDRFIALPERYEIARRLGANLLISIHADSALNPNASGATLYTLSETASDRAAAALAQRENLVQHDNSADSVQRGRLASAAPMVTPLLIDLTQRETMALSVDFAKLIHRTLADDLRFTPEFHRFAGFSVLKAPDIPSILFETGYISNARDLAVLISRNGQRRIAIGMAHAIELQLARQGLIG